MIPRTDVVIPVYNALEYVRNCMETVLAHSQNIRLILVDDHSEKDTTDYLMEIVSKNSSALYVRAGSQRWFTRASNLGLRLVRTSRVMLLNSDCVVNDGWLEELYAVWADAEAKGLRVGLVGSTYSEGESRRWAESLEPNYVTGHAVLYSMEALNDISVRRGMGGWYLDEVNQSAIHINSDRFACYEMNRAGWRTVASMKAAVGHHGGKSWGYNLGRISGLRIGDQQGGEVIG